jgi:superfamily II DNA or RNA helicase
MSAAITLYKDQEEFLQEIRKLWKHRRIIAMAPTGAGKTRIAAKIIEGVTQRGLKVCFVVPRISLISQTVESFESLGLADITIQWGENDVCDNALITVASIDTMIRRAKREYDLIIIDEAHKKRKQVLEWMNQYPNDRYIGLTATPYAEWMGNYYTAVARSKPMRWLISNNRLSNYTVYAPHIPNTSKLKTKVKADGERDYLESELEAVMGDSKVVGDVVQYWLENGENRLTMALCVNVKHANYLMIEFNKAGVEAEVITANVKVEERERIFQRVKDGITRVLLSVDCLTEGFDIPEVSCLISARPTKSLMRYVQGMGRVLRYVEGKHALIFDHSGTTLKLGMPCSIEFDFLKDKEDGLKEVERREKEKPEKKPKECPECKAVKEPGVVECPECGFIPKTFENVENDTTVKLEQVEKKANKESKQRFYSELLGWQRERLLQGRKASDGYIAHLYKARFGVWPKGLEKYVMGCTPKTRNFIRSRQIAYAKGRAKHEDARSDKRA